MEGTKKQNQDTRLIIHLFAELKAYKLTESQQTLIKGMKRYFRQNGVLSEKQLQTLLEIQQYNGTV